MGSCLPIFFLTILKPQILPWLFFFFFKSKQHGAAYGFLHTEVISNHLVFTHFFPSAWDTLPRLCLL